MRWLTIAVALTALVLVGAGCGGDDDAASDATTLTEATTDETTTDDTTTDETTTDDDSGDLGDFASGECAELIAAGQELSQALGAAGAPTDDDIDELSELYDDFAARAPEEIRADIRILADAWDVYADILPDLQVEPGETPDPEALAELQQALASIDQANVTAASQRIADWAEANCPSG